MLDSSVAVKWFSREEGSEEALELMDRHVEGSIRLWVVDIAYGEVANALRYNPGFGLDGLTRAVELIYGLHLGSEPITEGLLRRSAEIAFDGDVTIYDALPVALAEAKGALCVTGDMKTQFSRLSPKGYPLEPLSGVMTGSKIAV